MERVLLALLVLCVVVNASRRNHPKFSQCTETVELPIFEKAEHCTDAATNQRHELIRLSMCSDPKDVFVELKPTTSYEQLLPGAVWVKRCVGLCDGSGSTCEPREKRFRNIPVKVFNLKSRRESCTTYQIEEHLSCGCSCPPDDCPNERIRNPRKCTCQCPNLEERRSCLTKRAMNMRWNRIKCRCEKRKKIGRTFRLES